MTPYLFPDFHQTSSARVGVFIDAQNLFKSLMSVMPGKKIDYNKMLYHCLSGRTLYCARFYEILAEQDFQKDKFLHVIRKSFEVLTKPVQVFPGGVTKGDWDIGMAVDMIALAEKLDVVVLGSGDGDFLPVVNHLKHRMRCRVEGVSFTRTTNSALLAAFDSHTDLGDATKALHWGLK